MTDKEDERNARGQLITNVKKSVENGELYEEQFRLYIKNRFDIDLIKHEDKFNSYDFTIKNNENIFIEYKALNIKTVIENKPFFYDNIVIPKSKIDEYIKIYEDGIKNNKLIRFFYMISLFYMIDDVQYKKHKFIYLDLYKIKCMYSNRDKLVGNRDDKEHYNIPHKFFKGIGQFQHFLTT